MKIERVSEHIWSLKSWLVIPVHVWVVESQDGLTLVDAGFPVMAKGISKFIEGLDMGPLQRILLTHGHSDHVGSLANLKKTSNLSVYAHRIEIPYMTGELVYPRRKKAEFNVPKEWLSALPEDANGAIEKVAGLRPYLTPGHSPGHVVYYHEQDRVMLAGDLFTSKRGKLHRPMPMFTADMAEALRSSAIVKELDPLRVEVCHGEPVHHPAEHLDWYVQSTAKALSLPTSGSGSGIPVDR